MSHGFGSSHVGKKNVLSMYYITFVGTMLVGPARNYSWCLPSYIVHAVMLPPSGCHGALQMGWGNQGGDSDMFGMWMEDLGEEQSSDRDDVSPLCAAVEL